MGILNDLKASRPSQAPSRIPTPRTPQARPGASGGTGILNQVAAQREAVTPTQGQQTNQLRADGRLNRDFRALQESRPDEVEDWKKIAELTVSLSGAGDDPQAQELKNALMWTYGDQLRPHIDTLDEAWWDSNFTDQPKPEDDSFLGWKSKVGALSPVFDYLDQWGQSALSAGAGIEAAIDTKDDVSVGEGLRHALRKGTAVLDVTRAIPGFGGISQYMEHGDEADNNIIRKDDGTGLSFDRDQDGSLNLREMLGKDPEAGGRGLGAIDLIGTIALDPSTFATLGQSSYAKLGMRAAEEMAQQLAGETVEALGRTVTREMVQEMNQRIAREGFKRGLDEAEQRWYTSLLRMSAEQAVERGGRSTTRLGRDIADEQLMSIARGGQSGLRMGGTTILPTGRLGEVLGRGSDNFIERAAPVVDEAPFEATPLDGTRGLAKLPEPPAQGVLDFTPPKAPIPDELAGTQLSLDGVRNFGFGQDAVKIEPLNKPMQVYTQQMIPGIKPMIARQNIQQLLISGADEAERLMTGAIHTADTIPGTVRGAADRIGEALLPTIIRDGGKLGLLGHVLSSAPFRRLTGLMSTNAGVAARFGRNVAEEFRHLQATTREAPEVGEIMQRLGGDLHKNGLMASSIREFADLRSWNETMNRALSSAEAREAALAAAGPKTAQLINTFQTVREEVAAAAIRGGANPEHLRNLDEYLPRILSSVAKNDSELLQRIKNVDEVKLEMGGDRVAESFLQTRTIAEKLDNLFDANSEAARVLSQAGIGDVAELFEQNVVAAMTARARSAFRAATDVDLLNGLTKMEGDGVPLAFMATADDAARLSADSVVRGQIAAAGGNIADYRVVRLENGTVYRVHETIASELENVRRIFGDPRELTKLGEFFDKANNVWAMSATVMGVNPAFHIRNGIGNVFNAFLGGTRNPAVFARAAEMQRHLGAIEDAMRATGDTFEEAARKLDLDKGTVDILVNARKLGVLNDGRSLDILRERGGIAATPTGQRSALQNINPADPNSVWNRAGARVGAGVENNARLGVYLDQLDKGGTHAAAAQHVKRTLFDYGDLTRFESETIRRVSRFYTFMRKNTALQAYTLAHYPSRIANAEEATQGVVDAIFGGESAEDRSLPPWMGGARVMDVAGSQLAVDVDTPWASFEDTVGILLQPPSDDPLVRLQTEGYLRGVVDRTTTLFSGVAPAVFETLNEIQTGVDSFTGRPLDPENQMRDRLWFRGLSSVFPAASRFEGIAARAGLTRFDEEGNPKSETGWEIQLLNVMSGLKTYELTDDSDGSARYVLIKELEETMKAMEEDGVDVPTIEEMREQGDLQVRSRVVEALMYAWDPETGEWSDSVRDDRLLNIIPKDVREALQLPEPSGTGRNRAVDRGARPDAPEGSEEDMRQQDIDFKQALDAIEVYLDRPLTEDERWTMVSAFGGALSVTDQENAGFNPHRANRLIDPEKSEADERADLARKEALFNQRLSAVGMDWGTALERHPRISVMQRNMQDAREAGWSDEEIRTALYYAKDEGGLGWTSRDDRAAINQFMTGDRAGGAVPLTLSRFPVTSEEDLQKLQTKVWNAAEELRLIYQFEGWGAPRPEHLQLYGLNALTNAEQRLLGYDPLRSAPRLEDARSDLQKMADAQAKGGAVQAGLQSGPYRWSPTAQPTYEPWE